MTTDFLKADRGQWIELGIDLGLHGAKLLAAIPKRKDRIAAFRRVRKAAEDIAADFVKNGVLKDHTDWYLVGFARGLDCGLTNSRGAIIKIRVDLPGGVVRIAERNL
jgi:hypothetical protein